jgi:hypothetical protein
MRFKEIGGVDCRRFMVIDLLEVGLPLVVVIGRSRRTRREIVKEETNVRSDMSNVVKFFIDTGEDKMRES